MLRYSNQKTAENRGMNWQDSGQRYRSEMAARRRRDVFAHHSSRSEQSRANFHRNLGCRRVFAPTMGKDMEANQSRAALAIHPGSQRGSRSLRASDRDASVASEHLIHAKHWDVMAQR